MGIGTSIFLIAVGAILRFAVYTSVRGIALGVIGIILMIVGVLGLILTMTLWGPYSYRARHERYVRTSSATPGVGAVTTNGQQTVVQEDYVDDSRRAV